MPEPLSDRLLRDFGLKPIVATEIEFYLTGIGRELAPEDALILIEKECARADIRLACAEKERGPDQYEVSLLPTQYAARLAEDTERFKRLMYDVFTPYGVAANFSAKPMLDAPGSGLHVHVHLEDMSGKNVFFREHEVFSPELLHSIGGMLAFLNPCMPIFAPSPASYLRFTHTVNAYLVCPTAANVPLTVSWGTNNRTVAIRLPNKPMDHKHIEHRVAGSDAEVAKVIEAIFAGIHYGLVCQSDPGAPTYGDASMPQYALLKIASNLETALLFQRQSTIINSYLS